MKLVLALLALACGAFAADSSTPGKIDALLAKYQQLGILNARLATLPGSAEDSISQDPDTEIRVALPQQDARD